MLRTSLLHPQILKSIAQAGHHAKILIADGNYPASSKKGPKAELVSLQLTPGIPIDKSDEYALDKDPAVWSEYRAIMKEMQFKRDLEPIVKWDFYDAVMSEDHVLTIQTADQATWANLLLLVGVRT